MKRVRLGQEISLETLVRFLANTAMYWAVVGASERQREEWSLKSLGAEGHGQGPGAAGAQQSSMEKEGHFSPKVFV